MGLQKPQLPRSNQKTTCGRPHRYWEPRVQSNQKTIYGRSLVDPDVQKIFIDFINKNSGSYLEIGCYEGVTLSGMADSLKEKTIYGIDPFISDGHLGTKYPVNDDLPDQRKALYDNISTRKNIKFFEMTSEKFLKTQDVEKYDISVVFIDGSHTLDCVLIDIDLALKAIGDKRGMVFFDDAHISDVTKAIDVFEKRLSAKNSKKEITYQETFNWSWAPCKYFIIQNRGNNEKRI